MIDVTRYFARQLDPDNELERGLPCAVRYEDAGGWCQRTATLKMYAVLNSCEEHGEEARIGALMEAYHDAAYFFDRFRNPHAPGTCARSSFSGSATRATRDRPRWTSSSIRTTRFSS